ncbi:histone-like nucleoid-structuring protein Lsr2 [Streptomyces sp. MMBL 11-1]|uniref:histone-like nucleoid-structuring protein Lsr2 n=1 Tax=Streptomyces sp. MMBL 11-1 TaxID=3026420 RepID=UPI0030815D5B
MLRTIVTTTDDLANDGTLADETIRFALDGTQYEIDLTSANADTLRSALAPYIRAGRTIRTGHSNNSKSGAVPMETPAGGGATSSRHQGGINPAEVRAWAREHDVPVPKRGRLPKDVKDAYSVHTKFGDRTQLDALLRRQSTDTEALTPDPTPQPPTPSTQTEATEGMLLNFAPPAPAENTDKPTSESTAPQQDAKQQPAEPDTNTPDDPEEAEARKHYRNLKEAGLLSARASADGYWERRTAGGLERTDKVESMTLAERISILTERNVTLLGKLAGILNLDKGGKISYLAGSIQRMENLEVIVEDRTSPHGWAITDFGRYAHSVHSLGE